MVEPELNYLISDNRDGLPMIFIHGAAGSHKVWTCQWEYFKDKRSVIILDLPGHGDSKGDPKETIDEYADAVLHTVKELNLKKIILVGHSMGGAVSQKITLNNPDMISGLILIGTGARLRVSPQVFDTIESDFENFINMSVDFSVAEAADEHKKSLFKDSISESNAHIALSDFTACDRFDIMGEVEKIAINTLLVFGAEDIMTPVKYAHYLNQKIRNSSLTIIPGAGHMVMMEKPEAVNKAISGYLDGNKL